MRSHYVWPYYTIRHSIMLRFLRPTKADFFGGIFWENSTTEPFQPAFRRRLQLVPHLAKFQIGVGAMQPIRVDCQCLGLKFCGLLWLNAYLLHTRNLLLRPGLTHICLWQRGCQLLTATRVYLSGEHGHTGTVLWVELCKTWHCRAAGRNLPSHRFPLPLLLRLLFINLCL